jgi:hypothetical protein
MFPVVSHVNSLYPSHGGVVGWGTMLQAGRSPVQAPDEVNFFFSNLPNPSSRTMALGSTQPLTKMSTRNLLGIKSGQRVRLTTLPPSVSWMSENVGASTSRNPKGLHGLYRDNSTYLYFGTRWKDRSGWGPIMSTRFLFPETEPIFQSGGGGGSQIICLQTYFLAA